MDRYEKTGYLREPFRLFRLKDKAVGEMSLHYHDFYKIFVFYGGNVTYMVEGKSYVLEPGDIVLVNRYDIHKPTVDASAAYERSILYISAECLESCRAQGYDPFLCFTQAAERKSYVLRIEDFAQSRAGTLLARMESGREQYGWEREQTLLFELFLLELNRFCAEGGQEREKRPGAVYNRKVIDLLSYLQEHLFEDISIDTLAKTFYISKYHMMRKFKEETGYSMHQYILEKRIQAARSLILTGVPATVASTECGFKDYSTFSRACKKILGKMPSEVV